MVPISGSLRQGPVLDTLGQGKFLASKTTRNVLFSKIEFGKKVEQSCGLEYLLQFRELLKISHPKLYYWTNIFHVVLTAYSLHLV